MNTNIESKYLTMSEVLEHAKKNECFDGFTWVTPKERETQFVDRRSKVSRCVEKSLKSIGCEFTSRHDIFSGHFGYSQLKSMPKELIECYVVDFLGFKKTDTSIQLLNNKFEIDRICIDTVDNIIMKAKEIVEIKEKEMVKKSDQQEKVVLNNTIKIKDDYINNLSE